MKTIDYIDSGVCIAGGVPIQEQAVGCDPDKGREKTIAYKILRSHEDAGS